MYGDLDYIITSRSRMNTVTICKIIYFLIIISIRMDKQVLKTEDSHLEQQHKQNIVYNHDECFKIKMNRNNFRTFKILDPLVVKTIRLQLNRKGRRGGKNEILRNQTSISIANLSQVELQADKININNKIKLAVANVQSLKPIEEEVLDYLVSANVDISVLTETWLQTSDSDNVWVSFSSLNNSNFHLSVSYRVRRGGGLAIVHKRNLQCKELCW